MKTFIVWIPMLVSEYERNIVHRILNDGHQVAAFSEDGELSSSGKDCCGAIICLKLTTDQYDSVSDLSDYLRDDILYDVKYHGLILVEGPEDSCWSPSNIELPALKEPGESSSPYDLSSRKPPALCRKMN